MPGVDHLEEPPSPAEACRQGHLVHPLAYASLPTVCFYHELEAVIYSTKRCQSQLSKRPTTIMTCNDGKTPSDGEALEVSASRDASDDPEAEITSPSDHVSQRDPTITKTAKPNSADVLSQDGREQAQPPVDSAASALGFFRRRRLLWATLHVGIWIVMTGYVAEPRQG